MKETMTFVNLVLLCFLGVIVIGVAASEYQSKNTLIAVIITWLYILCNFLALKEE